ncbi:MAG: Alanine--tRNA ligase [Methanocella sp. PtaU1.Bin125]|nr:MAG: Alanine--tRNA ligase [Methanocella sp. PtaU1.Bin125]
MDRRLYNESPYIKDWQTEVREVAEKDGKYHVTLAETAFYPEQGGQLADYGTIDGVPVEGLYERDCTVYHILPSAPANRVVSCRLDFARRFDHMQQHTGQHILSNVFEQLFKADTSSFHMGEEDASIELSMPDIPAQAIKAAEDKVNEYLYRDPSVKTHVVSPEEARRFPGVTPPEGADVVRVVEIETVEYNACCGTHVSRLGEIGIIKIVRTEKMGAGQTRAYFKCGRRALQDYQVKHDVVATLGRQYKVTETELVQRIDQQAAQLKAATKEIEALKNRLLDIEATEMAKSVTSPLIVRSYEDRHFEELNFLGKHIMKNGSFVLILSSVPDMRLVFARGEKFTDINCGKLFKEHLQAYKGKGGGSPNWANAGFASVEDMKRFEAFLLEHVGELNPGK